jgi:hypothetical protein
MDKPITYVGLDVHKDTIGHLEKPPQIACFVIPFSDRAGGVGHGATGIF